jgi:hypothetical protein
MKRSRSPDTLCGFNGTTVLSTVDNFGSNSAGSSWDFGYVKQTYTADNGCGVVITWDAGRLVFEPPIANADGTTTQVASTQGLNVKTQALRGPLLQQSTGNAQITFVFDADGNLLSISAITKGPESNVTGQPDCSVIWPYLAGA